MHEEYSFSDHRLNESNLFTVELVWRRRFGVYRQDKMKNWRHVDCDLWSCEVFNGKLMEALHERENLEGVGSWKPECGM